MRVQDKPSLDLSTRPHIFLRPLGQTIGCTQNLCIQAISVLGGNLQWPDLVLISLKRIYLRHKQPILVTGPIDLRSTLKDLQQQISLQLPSLLYNRNNQNYHNHHHRHCRASP